MCETIVLLTIMGSWISDDPFQEPPPPIISSEPTMFKGSNETWKGWERPSPKPPSDSTKMALRDRLANRKAVTAPTPMDPTIEWDLPKPNVASAVAIDGQVFPQPTGVWPTEPNDGDLVFVGEGVGLPMMLGDMMTRRELVHQRLASRFKIADNNSPIPSRRGMYSFNAFSNPFNQGGTAFRHSAGLEVWGFNRRASLDFRGALGSFTEPLGDRVHFPTDVTATFKALFWDQYGVKMSAGVGTAIPVGGEPHGTRSTSFVLSPFLGWTLSKPESPWFLHGFEQLDFPLTDDHQILLQTDVGVGYWLVRSSERWTVTAIAPTVELHLYTPLGDSPGGSRTGLLFADVLNATVGVNFFFGAADSLGIGMGLPLLGDRDYDWEAQVHYVRRF